MPRRYYKVTDKRARARVSPRVRLSLFARFNLRDRAPVIAGDALDSNK